MGVTFGPESSVIAKPPGSPCDSLDINFIINVTFVFLFSVYDRNSFRQN